MAKFDGWLICSDFDGTIFSNNLISDENCKAIKYFQDNGGLFTIVSGRYTKMMSDFFHFVRPNAPLATHNGSVIVDLNKYPDDGCVLFSDGISKDDALDISLDLFERPELKNTIGEIRFYTQDDGVILKRGQAYTRNGLKEMLDEMTPKIVVMVSAPSSDGMLRLLTEELGERYDISRSWVRGIEINPKGINKGKAALMIKEMTGAEHLVCMGDYENDIPMIKSADIGIAVGTSVDALKNVADRITVDYCDHVASAVIRDIENGDIFDIIKR